VSTSEPSASRGRQQLWLDRITDSDVVFIGTACGEPQTLTEELIAQRDRWRGLRLLTGLQGSPAAYANAEYAENFRLTTFMSSRSTRDAFASGRADHIPASVYQTARLLSQGRITIDVALVQVSPPDARGFCSLGVSVAYNRTAVRAARTVVAEINDQMPYTLGDGMIHVSEFDEVVHSDRPVLSVSAPKPVASMAAIGKLVAGYVNDGSSVQVGVGGVSDAIWSALGSHNDIRVHTGAAGDAVMRLLRSGVITAKEGIDPHPAVTAGQLIGSAELYRFAHQNKNFWLGQPNVTHNPAVIGGLGDFVSVISALQVDLRGQVNSEMVGGTQVAGVGGALDFATGAMLAERGCSIVALPSTAGGAHSRIVPRLPDGVVTIPSTLVDVVVTEHGSADLRGLPLAARREALVAIAAPQFRDQLTCQSDQEAKPTW
jgi:4-hydroxybutyrate CoA-transferase